MFNVLFYGLLGVAMGPLAVLTSLSIVRREPLSWRPFAAVDWTTFVAASAVLGSVLVYGVLVNPLSAALVSWVAIVGLVLSLVDWMCHRLPHFVVGTLFVGGLVQIGLLSFVLRDVEPLLRAGGAAVVVFAAGLLLFLRFGNELGFGDVTLASTLALFLGWHGWSYVALGLLAGLLAAAAVTQLLILRKLIDQRDPVALGPGLLFGAVYVMLQA